jgi:hypothetical protein
MNYSGNYINYNKEHDITPHEYHNKLWYILYKSPKNTAEYYTSISMANIFNNETIREMNYNLPYKNAILDHISINKQ